MKKNDQSKNSCSSRTTKYIKTGVISYCTFAYGCGFTFLSPTIIDFSKKFDTEVQEISIVFTILTGCFALGAFTYGILSSFLHRQLIVICLLSIMSVALLSIPHVSSLPLFYFLSGCLGLGSGGYEAAQISWTIDIWLEESAPFILIQYFAFAVGTVIPPLLLSPFLSDEEENSRTMLRPSSFSLSSVSSTNKNDLSKESDLLIPFVVAASLLALGVLIQIVLFFVSKSRKVTSQSVSGAEEEETNNSSVTYMEDNVSVANPNKSDKWRTIKLVLLSCCVIGIYQGMELTSTLFLPTFAVYADVGLSEAEGAQILFGLTLSYALARGVGILIVLKIPPQFILCGNFVLLIVSNLVLLFFGQTSLSLLWTGSVMLGLAMSTACPSSYAFIENHLHVTDRIASTIVVTAGTVSAISPLLVGNSVQVNPSILCYVNLGSISVLILSFGVMYWFVTRGTSN